MKLTINREQLLYGLTTVARAINDKHPIPVLRNVKLEVNERGLSVIGSNNELIIEHVVPFKIDSQVVIRNSQEGVTLVSSRLLTDIVRKLEGRDVTIEVIDSTLVQVDDGRSNFRLNSINPEDYPDVDLEKIGESFVITGGDFANLVDQTAFAASTREVRPTLTAVNLTARDNELVGIATDSFRMAKKVVKLQESAEFKVNVPAKILTEIARLVQDEQEVEIHVTDKKALFYFNATTVSSRLISGEYPSIENIIPDHYDYFLEANADELLRAMDRVSLLTTNERESVVKLTMSEEGGVQLSTRSLQTGSAIESLNTCQFTGERLEISFNSNFVSAAVRACKSQDVIIGFVGEMKPFSVRNVADNTHIQIVTPVRTY
ncbi:MAG: DNA polymerase III subunit beta [Erysipelotrichaceae bacterium]|nr:DNA polymerase III subunit beta [Erysipelotrichaceae bacterium]